MTLYEVVRGEINGSTPEERCDAYNAATDKINAMTMDELLNAISEALERGVVRGQLVSE